MKSLAFFPRSSVVVAAGLIVVALGLAYANTFTAPFVFDDHAAILENPTIRHLWPLTTPLSPPADGRAVAGRPLVNLSLALNYAIGGTNPAGYHLFNLAIHALSTLLLFGLVRRTLADLRGAAAAVATADLTAALAAAIWALHPLQTESVSCVVQRTESLGAFWYLLTLHAFVRRRPIVSVLACLVGMATKETVVTAPLIVLLFDRTFVAGSFNAAWRARRGYYLALGATWLLLAWLVLRGGGARGTAGGLGAAMSSWHYLLQQCRAIILYLKLSLWPHPLVVDYGSAAPQSLAEVWWQALVIVVLLAATIWALVRRPVLGCFGAWFFIILAPSSSVVPLPAQTIAEHRMYLPLAAIVVALVVGVRQRFPARSTACLTIVALALGFFTAQRNAVYRSDLALWADTAAHVPDNPRVQLNLGGALLDAGRDDDARAALTRAEKLQPNLPGVHSNLCLVDTHLGRLDEAIAQGEAAIELAPDDADAWVNLTHAYLRAEDSPAARRYAASVARLKLADTQLYFLAGNLAARAEDFVLALELFRRAVQIDPSSIPARNNFANVLLVSRRFDEAIAEYEAILRLHPDDRSVRENLERAREAQAASRS